MKRPRCSLHRGLCQQVFILCIEKPPHRDRIGGLVDINSEFALSASKTMRCFVIANRLNNTSFTFWAFRLITGAKIPQKLMRVKVFIHLTHLQGYSGYSFLINFIISFRSPYVNCGFLCFASCAKQYASSH